MQLIFCRYRRAGFSFVCSTPKVQVPGFTDEDTYKEVVQKGAQGLGTINYKDLQFLVSSGVVNNTPLANGEHWSLGGYVEGIRGQTARGKKLFGLYVPYSDEEDDKVCF